LAVSEILAVSAISALTGQVWAGQARAARAAATPRY